MCIEVTLCATTHKARDAWEKDHGQTILANPMATLWVVGYPPEISIGHVGWYQISAEELP